MSSVRSARVNCVGASSPALRFTRNTLQRSEYSVTGRPCDSRCAHSVSALKNRSAVSRLVASPTNTISVQRGPRPSNQPC